jgi:hypothetical protein
VDEIKRVAQKYLWDKDVSSFHPIYYTYSSLSS